MLRGFVRFGVSELVGLIGSAGFTGAVSQVHRVPDFVFSGVGGFYSG